MMNPVQDDMTLSRSWAACGGRAARAACLALLVGLVAACGGGGGSKIKPDENATAGPAPASLTYLSATPDLIYLSGAPGPHRADVVFEVRDATGAVLAGEAVRLQLANALLGTALDGAGADGTVTIASDAEGKVRVTVLAGTVPGAVRVAASVVDAPTIATSSLELRVATGRPAQSRASLAATVLSIEGYQIDGTETTLTLSLADRQGNPVPDGTQVNFVAESGAVFPSTCVVAGGTSRCSVVLRSQGVRPANGQVSILAYTPGEEDFTDLNGNNAWDSGEPFADMGDAFRDDNENGAWEAGEFQVRRGGAAACAGTDLAQAPGRANTCDGRWGETDVRRQIRIVFATSEAQFTASGPSVPTTGTFDVLVADRLGNSLATGSTVSVLVRPASDASSCTAEVSPTTVPNGVRPTLVRITTKDCLLADRVELTARSPSGIATVVSYGVQ